MKDGRDSSMMKGHWEVRWPQEFYEGTWKVFTVHKNWNLSVKEARDTSYGPTYLFELENNGTEAESLFNYCIPKLRCVREQDENVPNYQKEHTQFNQNWPLNHQGKTILKVTNSLQIHDADHK